MTETDFDKAKKHLQDYLDEMKKGGHDQLGTSLANIGTGLPVLIIEAVEHLIEGTQIVKERWNR